MDISVAGPPPSSTSSSGRKTPTRHHSHRSDNFFVLRSSPAYCRDVNTLYRLFLRKVKYRLWGFLLSYAGQFHCILYRELRSKVQLLSVNLLEFGQAVLPFAERK